MDNWENILSPKQKGEANDKITKGNNQVNDYSRGSKRSSRKVNELFGNNRTPKENAKVFERTSNSDKQTSDVKNQRDNRELESSFSNEKKYSISDKDSDVVENFVKDRNYKFKTNGNLEVNNLTNKQINDLIKLYKKTGYSDVSSDYLRERLKQGNMVVQREVADRFIEKELGYKPKYDTTKIFEDSEGNKLTKEQVEFFKDSDVRDIRGRLIPVYHRTNADFTVFDKSAGKQHGSKYGKGFYFSITPENYGNNTMEVYLNAKEGEFKYIPDAGYYIVQEPNQIKNVDNTTPTSNPDIRYSISEKTGKLQDSKGNNVKLETSETGTTGSLMAIHNLTSDKMKGILELGGFPVPSIAITDPSKVSHDNYGNISVLFSKDTIDPVNSKNKVYNSDIYSARFPNIIYQIDKAKWNNFEKWVTSKGGSISGLYAVRNNIENNYLDERNMKANLQVAFHNPPQELVDEAYDKVIDTLGNKRIEKSGIEPFKPDGSRKPLSQTSMEYTLDNLVREMTKKRTQGSEGNAWTGVGEIRANTSKKFSSIKDIKKNFMISLINL